MNARQLFIGVDIGGTFTDVVLAEEPAHHLYSAKALTTTAHPEEAVVAAIMEVLDAAGCVASDTSRIVHATTLATNLVLERKGARVAHVATKGYRELVQLQQLGQGGDLLGDERLEEATLPPLVPRHMIEEVRERLDWKGEVIEPLDEADAERAIEALAALAPESVSVCLLHSYANPDHERRLAEMIALRLPNAYVTLSSDVWPDIGEDERASTTIVSAYVGPVMARYLRALDDRLAHLGFTCPLQVMQSAGSVMPAHISARKAVYSIESGPAAGVIRAAELARRTGRPNLLSFDMGGTTAKVGLIRDYQPAITNRFQVGGSLSAGSQKMGETIRIPVIDLAEIGAGGGSIASVDDGGFLQVGPHSAGARPGPACYGLGSELPTVTDANVVLGYINPEYFLGGKMRIYPELSREAIDKHVAGKLGLDVVAAAQGVYQLANVHMGSAIRALTVLRGIDPREFAVTAFGGAGPLHIAKVAEQFDISTIIVPPSPGVASAYGLLTTDIAYDFVTAGNIMAGPEGAGEIQRAFETMEARGRSDLRSEGLSDENISLDRTANMHFVYQPGQLTVPFPSGPVTDTAIREVEDRFRDLYFEVYGVRPEDPAVFVSFASRAVGVVSKPDMAVVPHGDGHPERAIKGSRQAYFADAGGFSPTPVYDRSALTPGDHLHGPCIVEEPDSTVVCPPTSVLTIDAQLNLVMVSSEK